MEEIYRKARAKINLSLEVLEKRADNYHNIESVFQKINLYDEIYIRKTKTEGCHLQTNVEELNNQENIVYKAYLKLKEEYPNLTGIEVELTKKIPMQAGLAGGSTDCASFLLAMNELFDLKMSQSKIEAIGKSLGADVVPCLYHGAVFAEGIGDQITPISTTFQYNILIIKPKISCDTKNMYQKLDEREQSKQVYISNEIRKALEKKDIKMLAKNLYNVFENVIEPQSFIQSLKNELLQKGAIGSLMTGSGSCVYGIFENREKAKSAYQTLKEKYEVYLTTSYNLKGKNYDKIENCHSRYISSRK